MQHHLACLGALLCFAPNASSQWSTESLSQARTRIAAASEGTRAYFAGGWLGLMNYSDVVDIYDASTDSWTTMSLSVPRSEMAAASAGGLVFFAGGRDANGATNIVDILDPASGTWTTAILSQPRSQLAATAVGTTVVFACGRRGHGAPSVYSDVVDVYDTSTGVWTTTTYANQNGKLAATSSGSHAYFTSGILVSTSEVQVFEPATGTWTTKMLSAPRRNVGATRLLDQLLFAGGSSGPSGTLVDLFDLTSGTWSVSAMNTSLVRPPAATIGHRAVFVGNTAVEIYDATTGNWTTAPLSVNRADAAATSVGGRVLIAGGGGGSTFHDVVDIYEPELGTRYCSPGNPNSSGLSARITVDGSPFVSDQDLTLIADQLPAGEFGYFLVGANQGTFQPPGSQGILCLACGFQGCGGIGRFNQAGFIIQGPSGSISVDLTVLPTSPPVAVLPGDTWNFQCWHRDQGSSNFSDAVSVLFL
ncbi:MAG: hypothetical protein GY711_10295 [bacterium]|nr:hypothetical protein [bacterium]